MIGGVETALLEMFKVFNVSVCGCVSNLMTDTEQFFTSVSRLLGGGMTLILNCSV